MYEIFLAETRPVEASSILDVGVSVAENPPEESNILEQHYPHPARITMLGIHEGALLERQYPGTKYVRYDPAGPFPFVDRQFDICYCNAVIEHIGRQAERERFVRELVRVARKVFLTTPNRWYPVELHKGLPVLHWLPQAWYRSLLRAVGDEFYSKKENLDLLSRRSLERLLQTTGVRFKIVPYRFLGFVSNFLAISE
jgi:SAM-dependent methyltransferase